MLIKVKDKLHIHHSIELLLNANDNKFINNYYLLPLMAAVVS